MKIRSTPFGLLLCVLLLVPGTPASAQTDPPAAELVWSATTDFAGKMMDVDRFDNVYSVGDTIVGGIVLTRKFSPDGTLLWERSYRPEFAVKANWVAADPNGGAYVVGYKWTGSNQSAIGYFVLRYDADGNLVWTDLSDGGAAQAVRAVADRAGNAYVTGGLYVAGSYTIGIVKYSPAGRAQWVCPAVNPNGNGFPGTPLPTGLYLSDDGGSVAASGTSGYNYYVLSCDQSGVKRFQDFRDHSVYAAAVAVNNQGEVYFGNGLAGGAGMQITKYSAQGAVLWTNVYPQGDYIYRLALDSQGNVIATGPDYSNYYANWVTMKVAPAGALLWSATFDALTANNEIPAFVALDSLGQRLRHGRGRPGGGPRQRQQLYAHGHVEIQRGRRPCVDDRLDRRRVWQRRSGGQRRQQPVRAGLRPDVHRALPPDQPRGRRAPSAAARRGTGRADEPGRELEHPRQDQPHVDQHRHQRDVDHRTALQREHVHGVCRRRPARRDGEVLDRFRGEVALDISLSDVRVQRRGRSPYSNIASATAPGAHAAADGPSRLGAGRTRREGILASAEACYRAPPTPVGAGITRTASAVPTTVLSGRNRVRRKRLCSNRRNRTGLQLLAGNRDWK